jgi:hypothetical protein
MWPSNCFFLVEHNIADADSGLQPLQLASLFIIPGCLVTSAQKCGNKCEICGKDADLLDLSVYRCMATQLISELACTDCLAPSSAACCTMHMVPTAYLAVLAQYRALDRGAEGHSCCVQVHSQRWRIKLAVDKNLEYTSLSLILSIL